MRTMVTLYTGPTQWMPFKRDSRKGGNSCGSSMSSQVSRAGTGDLPP
ncbi:hypothetical protein F444_22366 [Phytophthora nicotianae P1976]|uniref:Uncharacterized protein n=1 Tax=Phytophthora nicotianae P1976 TaxID=1317066 RepID=A0A080YY04_PHYNI|nr:hypothetical protein F444_22366 [Phytophthora nicotianae P1976]